jgi:peptidoglycan L-alanyl-D-glutamate endopeptidase CwlK
MTDKRTEAAVAGLTPRARATALALLQKQNATLLKRGMVAKIICGRRTPAEQAALFARPTNGKDDDGDGRVDEADEKVTNARAWESWHVFGTAWDIGIFLIKTGAYVTSPDPYRIAALEAPDSVIAGATWKKPDLPHYELAMGMTTAQAKARIERGEKLA